MRQRENPEGAAALPQVWECVLLSLVEDTVDYYLRLVHCLS